MDTVYVGTDQDVALAIRAAARSEGRDAEIYDGAGPGSTEGDGYSLSYCKHGPATGSVIEALSNPPFTVAGTWGADRTAQTNFLARRAQADKLAGALAQAVDEALAELEGEGVPATVQAIRNVLLTGKGTAGTPGAVQLNVPTSTVVGSAQQ